MLTLFKNGMRVGPAVNVCAKALGGNESWWSSYLEEKRLVLPVLWQRGYKSQCVADEVRCVILCDPTWQLYWCWNCINWYRLETVACLLKFEWTIRSSGLPVRLTISKIWDVAGSPDIQFLLDRILAFLEWDGIRESSKRRLDCRRYSPFPVRSWRLCFILTLTTLAACRF